VSRSARTRVSPIASLGGQKNLLVAEFFTRGGTGNIPPPRRRALDPSRRGRATGLRHNHRRSSHRSRRSRGPHRPTARDRYPCQRRPDQQRDRRPPIPLTPYCRLAPDLHIQNWPICVCTPRLLTNEVSAPSRRSACR